MVLELVPTALAQAVSQRLTIPTIGIGSGPGCDAQVQVVHDVLGLGERLPRHARRFAELRVQMREAFDAYAAEVRAGTFPAPANSIEMDPEELGKALEEDDRSA